MTRKTLVAVWLSSLICPAAFSVQLVKDINSEPLTSHTVVTNFAGGFDVAGGTVFFVEDDAHGLEPWVTDGTPAGTRLLKDIYPGPRSSVVMMVTLMNGVAFFFADDGANGLELWRSDGTPGGTHVVANIGPGSAAGIAGVTVTNGTIPIINGVLYFAGNDGGTGSELWRSDGTAGGTYRVSDGWSGSAGSDPHDFHIVGTRLYFVATDSADTELWTSDGTPAGTRRVADISPGVQEHITGMTVVGNVMFFTANDDVHGRELWRVNAAGNAAMVKDLIDLPRGHGSDPVPVGVVGDTLVFYADTSDAGFTRGLYGISANASSPMELIHSLPRENQGVVRAPRGLLISYPFSPTLFTDGTPAGTRGSSSQLPLIGGGGGVRVGEQVFFHGLLDGGTRGIFRTDGTVEGTSQYIELDDPIPGELQFLGGRIYFTSGAVNDPAHGREVWVSDGTPVGTHVLVDLNPGPGTSFAEPQVIGSRLFLSAFDGDTAFEPWISDGISAEATRLADFSGTVVTGNSEPSLLGNAGAYALFHADDGVHGMQLWSTSGSEPGTRMLTGAPFGSGIGTTFGMVELNGIALFSATSTAGEELWRTDGTPAGTYLVRDINPGSNGSDLRLYEGAVIDGVVYFTANDGVHGQELWRSDGTGPGTWLVSDFTPGSDSSDFHVQQATANSRIFLRASAGGSLYASDGTANGTVLVSSGLNISTGNWFAFQNRACFSIGVINSPESDYFCSNGLAGDITRLTDFASLGLSPTSTPYVLNGHVVLAAYQPGLVGGGLYACDGTPTGISKISDLHFSTGVLMSGGTRLAFMPDSGATDIFVTDGTAAGTRSMLMGTSVARDKIDRAVLSPVADSIVFRVQDPVLGPVAWKTDGTPAGTRFLFDVDPTGTEPDRGPDGFLVNGSRIFFSARRIGIGNELWSFSVNQPNAMDDFADTARDTPVNVPVMSNDSDFDGSLSGAMLEIVTQPASGNVMVNSGLGSITYTPNAGFSGIDSFVYRVIDPMGNLSNGAFVTVTTLAAGSTTGPGTAPSPPANPPSNPPPAASGGGGGGGGALGLEQLLLAIVLVLNHARLRGRRRAPALRQLADARPPVDSAKTRVT